MILRKTKEIRVNLGNFEHAIISVTIEADTDDLVKAVDDTYTAGLDGYEEWIDRRLDNWVRADIAKLSKVNSPLKDGESVIEVWEDTN